MAGRERGGPRILYHRRTRGAFVLPISGMPIDYHQFDDNGRVVRLVYPVAGASDVQIKNKNAKVSEDVVKDRR